MIGAAGAVVAGSEAAAVAAATVQASVPHVFTDVPERLLTAGELHAQIRGVPLAGRYQWLSTYFDGLAVRKLNGHGVLVRRPFDLDVNHVRLSQDRLEVLERIYGRGGHWALIAGLQAAVKSSRSGSTLTWNLRYFDQDTERAVATASILIHPGVAELCSAAALNCGLPGSGLQYQRLADFFGNTHHAYRVWGLRAELRAAARFERPSGRRIHSGAATQHINLFLAPFLLHSGVVYSGTDGSCWVEPQVDNRFYVQPEGVETMLFTPAANPYDQAAPSLAEIARVTYRNAFDIEPNIVSQVATNYQTGQQVGYLPFDAPRQAVSITGTWTNEELDNLIRNEEKKFDILEFAVINNLQNTRLQEQLYRRGFIPVGVWPGGEFTVQGYTVTEPTYLHYQRPKRDLRFQLVPHELARDYKGTEVAALTARLADRWQQLQAGGAP